MNASIKTLLLPVIVLLLHFSTTVDACTCGRVSPCESYANASVVFVGLVTKTSMVPAKMRLPPNAVSATSTSGSTYAHFKVEEIFRGASVKEVEVSGDGTTCDYSFKQGERYLVYAYQSPDGKTLHTTMCSGTAPLSEATDDLTYFRRVTKLPPGGTLVGDINRELHLVGKNEPDLEPIPNAEVLLVNGRRSFKAVSDVNGKFELRGLPRGRYKVHTSPPTNLSHVDVMAEEPRYEWELDIPGHGCVQTWFLARPVGEISGTVVDNSGIVSGDVEPELIPVDEQPSDTDVRSVRLSESRGFKFTFLPPGRYYLGFNLRSGPSLLEPYPEFYYPGVEDRTKARIINLSEGQKVSGVDLWRPPRLAERMVEGVATWPDGRPFISDCGIELTNPRSGYREGNCVATDAQGRFSIKAVEGQTYELSAMTTTIKSIALVRSKPLVMRVGKENSPVKLVVELP
jgi:hypothetical protein